MQSGDQYMYFTYASFIEWICLSSVPKNINKAIYIHALFE